MGGGNWEQSSKQANWRIAGLITEMGERAAMTLA